MIAVRDSENSTGQRAGRPAPVWTAFITPGAPAIGAEPGADAKPS